MEPVEGCSDIPVALVADQLWLPDARSAVTEAVCTPGRCWLRSAAQQFPLPFFTLPCTPHTPTLAGSGPWVFPNFWGKRREVRPLVLSRLLCPFPVVCQTLSGSKAPSRTPRCVTAD